MIDGLYANVLGGCGRAYPGERDVRIARAPGRVNIIGEHTDYNGLPVLPAAIDREIAIAFLEADSQEVVLSNVDSRFGQRRFLLSAEIEAFPAGDWGNYVKAACQAIWNWTATNSPESLPLRGIRACVDGTIPRSSGLSSSSALVVASAFALIAANGLTIDRAELAGLLARAECYVGTEGGGMDQAASILSVPGCVLKIDFNPLRTQPVPLPEDCMFVIANSTITADKAGGARAAYNARVAECRLGVQMLKSLARHTHPEAAGALLLGDIMKSVPDWRSAVDELPEGSLSLAEISDFCGLSEPDLSAGCLKRRDGSIIDIPSARFHVKKRCRHVLTEAGRVEAAVSAIREDRLDDLGRLMNESP